jgi:putative RNA 2'-phosphotransferase
MISSNRLESMRLSVDAREKTKTSKFLSLVLRHQPGAAHVALDEAGWVDVEALLAGCAKAGRVINHGDLDEVVATNEKKRFEFSEDGKRLRASQGHSVEVDLQYEVSEPPVVLYHGTAERNLESIWQKGLIKGKRHHVHLSTDVQTARQVGSRYGRPVVLSIDAAAMVADGREFFVSTNEVWLTDFVPVSYLVRRAPDLKP